MGNMENREGDAHALQNIFLLHVHFIKSLKGEFISSHHIIFKKYLAYVTLSPLTKN